MNNRIAVVLAVLFCALPLRAEQPAPAASPAAHNPDEVVARVSGKEIKRKELDAAMQGFLNALASRGQQVPRERLPEFERDMLEELIGRELILEEGRATKVPGLDEKVQTQVKEAKSQAGGDENFEAALKDSKITEAEYTDRVRNNIIVRETIQRTVEAKTSIKPEEVKTFYDQNREKFVQPEQVRASHILVRVTSDASDDLKAERRAKIDLIRTRLQSGEKFAAVAKEASEDPGSAANGGDLGYFSRGAMVPQFDVVAFTLKTNELSDVITTPFGYHVLIVTDRKPKQEVPFDDVKDRIEKHLKDRKGSEVAQEHVKQLRDKANVEVLLKTPAPVAISSKPLPTVETPPVAAPKP
jgi:peptidyl-prolyl cis-trans isomerase C